MAHSFSNLVVHVIFGTKDRYPFLTRDVAQRIHSYLAGIAREIGCVPLRVNGPENHVHLLLHVPATRTIADMVRLLKTNSSKWIHERFPVLRNFAWPAGYAAFSVSRSAVERVTAYIDNQQEHHRRVTLEEEYLEILKRNGIEYDERYVFE